MCISIKSKLYEKKSVRTPRMGDQGGTQIQNFIYSHHHFCKIHSPLMHSPIFEGYKLIRIKKSTNNVLERMIMYMSARKCMRLLKTDRKYMRTRQSVWVYVNVKDCKRLYGTENVWNAWSMVNVWNVWWMYGMYRMYLNANAVCH